MCGIAGYFGVSDAGVPADALLRAMLATLRHRGPDGEGIHSADGFGFAHARLSIIDIAAGAQPMANDDGTVWITFNGEIFNYVELRDELIAKGVRFRTHSDTEVIIRLYEAMGPDCVERLNGDFAFAIHDARRRRTMLARDRMGVRPLFYATHERATYFASEAKALFQVPGIEAELDPIALDQIFTFWFPLAPRTIFKEVAELPPAHVLIARDGKVSVRPYWQLEFPDADACGRHRATSATIAEEVKALLVDATRIRLRSDVPVGAYLSGGLDSSIVAAIAGRLAPERLRTFSVRFDDPEFDETRLPARDGGGARHRPQRGHLPAVRYRRALPRGDQADGAPHPAHRAGAALHAFQAGARGRLQGRADRRGRRRGVRRLRHLQGGEAPPLLRARSAIARAGRCSSRSSIPTCPKLQAQSAALSQGVLRDRPRRGRRSAVLAPAAVPLDRGREALLLRRSQGRACRLRRARRSPREPAGRVLVAGIRCRRRSISRPPTCFPATSSPRRATAWRWRMRSKAASRSSTTASWRWRRGSRRA